MNMQAASLEILSKANVPHAQALALVQVIDLEIDARRDVLATRHDIDRLDRKIDGLRNEVHAIKDSLELKIEGLQHDLENKLELKTEGLRSEMHAIKDALELKINGLQHDLENKLELKTEGLRSEMHAIKDALELKINGLQHDLENKLELKSEGLRSEIHAIKDALELKIEGFKNDLELKIADLRNEMLAIKSELVRWVFTCILGQTAVLSGAVYFLITMMEKHPR